VPMTRPPAGTGKAAAAEAAERTQAEYYRRLLAERRAEIDLAIVKLHTALPRQQAQSAVSDARALGRVVRNAERERKEIDRLIDALDRRFTPADLTPLETQSPPDEIIHPDGRSLLSISQRRRSGKNAGRVDQTKVS
jgi:hypothetical protein